MNKNKDALIEKFAERYPDIGDVARGAEVSAESLDELSHIVKKKMRAVEKKESPLSGDLMRAGASRKERAFAVRAPNLLTRCVTMLMHRPDAQRLLSTDERVREDVAKVLRYGSSIGSNLTGAEKYADVIGDPRDVEVASVVDKLEAVVNITDQVPATDEIAPYTGHLTDIADAALGTLTAVAQAEGGLAMDAYLEDNLHSVLASLEQLDHAA